nr:MAG: DNA pilot protein [Microviridae sp.]
MGIFGDIGNFIGGATNDLLNIGTLGMVKNTNQLGSMLPFGIGQGYANELNVEAQQKNLAYQMGLQQQIFGREDDAVQRREADLEAAGLSPTLAAGSAAGAGAVISTSAPQRGISPDILGSIMSLLSAQANVSKTAQDEATSASQEKKLDVDTLYNQILAGKEAYNLGIYKKLGIPTDSPALFKEFAAGQGVLDTLIDKLRTQPNNTSSDLLKKLHSHDDDKANKSMLDDFRTRKP